jgi:YidC/Oxa1 family membrane protein insertase
MMSFGLDLSKRPAYFISQSFTQGLVYASLVVVLGLLYFVQQKMVASRAAVSPTMSPTQAKIMQYLPVVFAAFQLFFLTGLVIYYMTQAVFRIGQNYYITKRFYSHEHSLGRKAQAAGLRAREEAKANGGGSGGATGGLFAQAKRDAQTKRDAQVNNKKPGSAGRSQAAGRPSGAAKPASKKSNVPAQPEPTTSKRVTPPKNRPTPSASRPQRPTPNGRPSAPARPKPPKK